jgi:hypothetical protein
MMGQMDNVYRLKPMVAARLLAEVTALVILVLLPLLVMLGGKFWQLSMMARALGITVSLVSLCILPAYGFVTYKVLADELGLHTFSLFKKQIAAWPEIKTIKLKTSWGWRRYVVDAAGGELSFPIWLMNVRQLCETIRSRLPNRGSTLGASAGGGVSAPKIFTLAPSAVAVQIAQMAGAMLFIALMWVFLANMGGPAHRPVDPSDRMTMLAACIIFTLFLLARLAFYLLCPKLVLCDSTGLQLQTWFSERSCTWAKMKALSAAPFLLPEGLLITTDRWPLLIGDQLDAFDELQEELLKRLPPKPVAQK